MRAACHVTNMPSLRRSGRKSSIADLRSKPLDSIGLLQTDGRIETLFVFYRHARSYLLPSDSTLGSQTVRRSVADQL